MEDGAVAKLSKYEYIMFSVCDLNGKSRCYLVPTRSAIHDIAGGLTVAYDVMNTAVDGRIISVKHPKADNYGNAKLMPLLETLHHVPWIASANVGEVLCQTFWCRDGSPQEACPRFVAQKQIHKLNKFGYSLFSGFEFEFRVFTEDKQQIFSGAGQYSSHNLVRHADLLIDIEKQMNSAGVVMDRLHSEYCPGTFEAVQRPSVDMITADGAFVFHQGLNHIAHKHGLIASLMPQTNRDLGQFNTIVHYDYSSSLVDNTTMENVFYDSTKEHNLSQVAMHWLAGLMKHAEAICALCCSNVNIYRGVPGDILFPKFCYWGIDDREALFRVKNTGPTRTYIENRMPAGNCNPYLVLAATVAAGLDGIINKLECPPPGRGGDAALLPISLSEALDCLEGDATLREALGEELVHWFVMLKRDEIKLFDAIDDDLERFNLEMDLYL